MLKWLGCYSLESVYITSNICIRLSIYQLHSFFWIIKRYLKATFSSHLQIKILTCNPSKPAMLSSLSFINLLNISPYFIFYLHSVKSHFTWPVWKIVNKKQIIFCNLKRRNIWPFIYLAHPLLAHFLTHFLFFLFTSYA